MSVNILVYDRYGLPLGEIEKAFNISRSYALNKSTQMTFDIACTHPKATRNLLDYDNIIVAYSDKLPAWSGTIVNLAWNQDTLTVTSNSAEQKLGKRRPEPIKFRAAPYGEVFRHLVSRANAIEPTGVNLGDVFMGGPRIQMDLGTDDPYKIISQLCTDAKNDYQMLMLSPGMWEISFYEQVGSDLTDKVFLQMGFDTDGTPTYSEDWTGYCNSILATGKGPTSLDQGTGKDGSTGGANDDGWKKLPKIWYTDQAQVGLRGLAQDVIAVSDVEDIPTLFLRAKQEVDRRINPVKTLGFTLTERRDLWGLFEVGDILAVQVPYFGFNGIVVPLRITGYDRKEDSDQMIVVGDVVQGDKAIPLHMYTGRHYG